MKNIYLIIILMSFGCKEVPPQGVIKIPKAIIDNADYKQVDFSDGNHIVYYYAGDCSICYGNIATMQKEMKKIPLMIISSSTDTVSINYYLKEIKYSGPVFIDRDTSFYRSNSKQLANNKIFLVNSENQILAKSEYVFDKKAQLDFKEKL